MDPRLRRALAILTGASLGYLLGAALPMSPYTPLLSALGGGPLAALAAWWTEQPLMPWGWILGAGFAWGVDAVIVIMAITGQLG